MAKDPCFGTSFECRKQAGALDTSQKMRTVKCHHQHNTIVVLRTHEVSGEMQTLHTRRL